MPKISKTVFKFQKFFFQANIEMHCTNIENIEMYNYLHLELFYMFTIENFSRQKWIVLQ